MVHSSLQRLRNFGQTELAQLIPVLLMQSSFVGFECPFTARLNTTCHRLRNYLIVCETSIEGLPHHPDIFQTRRSSSLHH